MNHFRTGNLETLQSVVAEKNLDLRGALLAFHAKSLAAYLSGFQIVPVFSPFSKMCQNRNVSAAEMVGSNACEDVWDLWCLHVNEHDFHLMMGGRGAFCTARSGVGGGIRRNV